MLQKILRKRGLIAALIIITILVFSGLPFIPLMVISAMLGWVSGEVDYYFPYNG